MQVNGVNLNAISPTTSAEKTAGEAQMRLAKKVLNSQKEQMATLLNQLQGVGKNLDVKV